MSFCFVESVAASTAAPAAAMNDASAEQAVSQDVLEQGIRFTCASHCVPDLL